MKTELVILLAVAGLMPASGEDWATYRHDNRRSGVSSEQISGNLVQKWVRRSAVPPMTAWPGPAKWDAFSGNDGLQSMRNLDPVFFVTAADGMVYFGSSVDHAVHGLDAATGKERWVAFAGGAVRFPPTISEGRAYFGADDGYAYCVDARSGEEQWKFRPAKTPRLIPSDGKLISLWPVRTGVLIQDSKAYFGASLVPWETSYFCVLDAVSGESKFVHEVGNVTLQGALLGSKEKLYVPQGRSVPLAFAAADGKQQGSAGGLGGTFCLLTEDERLVAMPQNQKSREDVLKITGPGGGGATLSFVGVDRLVVKAGMLYLHQTGKLKALDRIAYGAAEDEIQKLNGSLKTAGNELKKVRKELAKAKENKELSDRVATLEGQIKEQKAQIPSLQQKQRDSFQWEAEFASPLDLALVGDVLFLGGDGEVVAVQAKTGKQLWSVKVDGKAYGLAFSGGQLFVSTSYGHIYCFGAE